MALIFFPHPDDANKGSLGERIDMLLDAAERFKAAMLDEKTTSVESHEVNHRMVPRDQVIAYNWEEISHVLREVRELSEANKSDKTAKGKMLGKLSEVYEVLRGAKMSKLEAVRLALLSEAKQLLGA